MLGVRRVLRAAGGVLATGALLVGAGSLGAGPADAELVEIAGYAYGVAGEVTVPPAAPDGDPTVIEYEPTPEVLLPPEGTDGTPIVESVTDFAIGDSLAVDVISVQTDGSFGTETELGGTFTEALLDNFELRDTAGDEVIAAAESVRAFCVKDELRELGETVVEEMVVDGEDVPTNPEPDTEYAVDGYGTVRFNVQQVVGDTITVTAMVVELDTDDGITGTLELGVAECGIEVLEVVEDGPDVVPDAVPADAFDGEPAFTG